MAHEWHTGVLTTSSWHGLETIGVMPDADAMIAAGERTNAWPVALRNEGLATAAGLVSPKDAIVATYATAPETVLGVVGDRYRATASADWRGLVRAAVAAGAKPTGAFSLRGGARVLATFEVGESNGLRTQLVIADAFDGSMKLTCGTSSIRVVCANTLSAALSSDGKDMAALRHTASLETKVKLLTGAIGEAIKSGETVRNTYHKAEAMKLTPEQCKKAFDLFFPRAPKDAGQRSKTIASNFRKDAMTAAYKSINNVGPTLGTLWNAATYLVDRNADGSTRTPRGGALLDSMLFGTRAERVNEVMTLVSVILADGKILDVPAPEAVAMGVDPKIVGRQVLSEMLED